MSAAHRSNPGIGWIEDFVRRGGSRPALLFEDRAIDHVTLGAAATSAAQRLRVIGVEAGDIVAVLAPPSSAGVALIHALLDRRIVLLPLNERFSEDELAGTLQRTPARFLLCSTDGDPALGRRLAERAGCGLLLLDPDVDPDLDPDLGLDPDADPLRDPATSAPVVAIALERSPDPWRAPDHASSRARRLAQGAAIVLPTSGTTGHPKGAVLGLDNLIASAEGSARLLGADADDRWLLCMPLFHIGGLSILTRSALCGASVVLQRRFDPEHVARALETQGITRVSFVATMLARLLDVRGTRPAPRTLALVLLGGGPASQSLLSHARDLGYPIAPTYGLTEATSQVATRPPDAELSDESDLAAGLQPLPGVEIRVVDERGNVVESGVEGEIQVRGPIVMRGYLDDPEASARAIREGWLATGDLGRLDARGRLRVLDRRTDLIVSGGENVYPAEIESCLLEHPAVGEACIVGVADERFGARPVAFVVLRAGESLDRADLASFCRGKLAGFKVPIDFIERASLPRTASGKLLRRELAIKPAERPARDPLR